MKNIGKCLILVIALSIMMSGVSILAESPIYPRVLYKGKRVSTGERIQVDSFNPDDWSIALMRRVNRRMIRVATLKYPDGFTYKLKRFVEDVDGARISAKTRIIFSNFRYKNGSPVTGLLNDSWDYYIEPKTPPNPGNPDLLKEAIEHAEEQIKQIPVLQGKSPSDVEKGKQFFGSPADLALMNSTDGLGQAKTLLGYFEPGANLGGHFDKPTEEEVAISIEKLNKALEITLGKVKTGTKESIPPVPNPPTPNPP